MVSTIQITGKLSVVGTSFALTAAILICSFKSFPRFSLAKSYSSHRDAGELTVTRAPVDKVNQTSFLAPFFSAVELILLNSPWKAGRGGAGMADPSA
jgi:hypothetical protein